MKAIRRQLLLFAVLAMLAVSPAHAGRIVAVGDVHGNVEGLTSILLEAGIVDEQLRWAGGTDTYVQLGDLFDRGVKVRESMDFLMRLEGEAEAAGGAVVVILGNHETMNLTGFFRDVNPEAYAAFADNKSEKRRKKLWSAVKDYRMLWGMPVDDAAREAWLADHPLGWIEYAEAIGPKGRYGKWLRSLPVAVMIGDVLFVHAGIGPTMAGISVEQINAKAVKELKVFDRVSQYLISKKIIPPGSGLEEVSAGTRAILREAEQEDSTDQIRAYAEQVRELADLDDWVIMSPEGPLWFRGVVRWSEEERGAEMEALLDGIGAEAMVVGHTPDRQGTIRTRFSNRVFLIDTGMLSSYYQGGRPSALEISGDFFTAIYLDGERDVLVGDEALDKVAALLPGRVSPQETAAAR